MAGLRSMASADENMDLQDVSELISDIMPRVFLMRNVHDGGGPTLVHTRWAMNYLRGPLTRTQIQFLMTQQRQELMVQVAQPQQAAPHNHPGQPSWQQQMTGNVSAAPPSLPGAPPGLPGMPAQMLGQTAAFNAQSAPPGMPGAQQQSTGQIQSDIPGFSDNQPPVSASVAQYFLPNRLTNQQAVGEWEQANQVRAQSVSNATLVYQPILLAQAIVRYQERKASIYTVREFSYHVSDLQRAGLIRWDDYFAETFDARSLSGQPFGQALFGDLPPGLTDGPRMKALKRELTDMLYNTALLVIPFNPDLKIYGNPDVDFSEFQATVYQAAREKRDTELDKVSAKYAGMMQKLEAKQTRKERELRSEKQEIKDRKREELFTTGEAMLSLWKGRTNYTLSRMSRASRYRKQTKDDISESYEVMEEIDREMNMLEEEFENVLQGVNDKWAQIANNTQEHVINPLKKDIQLELFGIGWLPAWYLAINGQATLLNAL